MKSKIVLSLVISVLICSFSHVFADVPQMINYQGKLATHQEVLVDDTVSIIFTIYDDSTGGTAFWSETQSSVVVKEGVFSVLLGSMDPIPDTVFTGEVRYLGVKVGEDSEMIPRRAIVSSGYAYRALVADSALTAPPSAVDDARYLNTDVPDSIVLVTDSSDQYLLTIRNQWTGSGLLVTTTHGTTIKAVNDAGSAIYASSNADAIVGVNLYEIASGQHCGVRGEALNTVPNMWGGVFRGWGGVYGQGTKYGVHGYSTDSTGVYGYSDYLYGVKGLGNLETSAGVGAISIWGVGVNARSRYGDAFHVDSTGGSGLWVDSAGSDGIHINKAVGWAGYFNGKGYFSDTVGIGTTTPEQELDVAGTVQMTGLKMPTGPSSGYVLTSDASGVGTWQPSAGGTDGDWTISGDSMYSAVPGNIGIGTTSPQAKLEIIGDSYDQHLRLTNTDTTGAGPAVYFDGVNQNWAIIGTNQSSIPGDGYLGFFQHTASIEQYRMVIDSLGKVGIGTMSPAERLDVAGTVKMTGFMMPPFATSGDVLTSDASGIGTWQELPDTVSFAMKADTANVALNNMPYAPGVSFSSKDLYSVSGSYSDACTLTTTLPDSGYLVVTASGYTHINKTGDHECNCTMSISETSSTNDPSNEQAAGINQGASNGNYRFPFSITKTFQVSDSGSKSFYLVTKNLDDLYSSDNLLHIQMTGIYFSTQY